MVVGISYLKLLFTNIYQSKQSGSKQWFETRKHGNKGWMIYMVYSVNEDSWLLSLGFIDLILRASRVNNSFLVLALPIILKWDSWIGWLVCTL